MAPALPRARAYLRGLTVVLVLALRSAFAASSFVYVGTYTDWDVFPQYRNPPGSLSRGIYLFRLDSATGALTPLGVAGETTNPSYIWIAPSGRFLYAANEMYHFGTLPTGAVTAFAIDRVSGKLQLLNQVSTGGPGPAFVRTDLTGRDALAANYQTGSITVLPIAPDGSLRAASTFIQLSGSGPNHTRQAGPHAHSINVTPDNRLALEADLGTDKLMIYRFDAEQGRLTPANPPFLKVAPGAGPRHLSFHPNGRFAYLLCEMGNTLTLLDYDAAAETLHAIQTVSTLPAGFKGDDGAAEVLVHPSGKFVYASDRGLDAIAVFDAAADGRLTPKAYVPSGGQKPRGFGIDPTGQWMITANQSSHSIVVYRIDPTTGIPAPTGARFQVRSPACVKFLARD